VHKTGVEVEIIDCTSATLIGEVATKH